MEAAELVLLEIIPKLPKEEKYDLVDQMKRACKAAPAILAEGYAKKHLKRSWLKYIHDVIGECNEMVVHLTFTKKFYGKLVGEDRCSKGVDLYDKAARMLFKLGNNWKVY